MKTAVIFGVTGQAGSYLAELLLSKGYRVVGVSRRVSVPSDGRIRHLRGEQGFSLVEGDVTDASCVSRIIEEVGRGEATEIFNLAAQSHVHVSFGQPSLTWDVVAKGTLNILEAIRNQNLAGIARFYQASSSEMFGRSVAAHWPNGVVSYEDAGTFSTEWMQAPPGLRQDEGTPFLPCSPYAIAKLAAHHLVRLYREAYGIFAVSGICFNHESPRRGEEFVTRKITKYVAALAKAQAASLSIPKLALGNLDAKRDWSHAADIMRGAWASLQAPRPDDYVFASGVTHSVRDFLGVAFGVIGCDWHDHVVVDPAFYRPCEVPVLRGDASKARRELGWSPAVEFDSLVREMVTADMGFIPCQQTAKSAAEGSGVLAAREPT